MAEILTDEQAAAIWSGQTSSLLGLEDPNKTPPAAPPPVAPTPPPVEPKAPEKPKVELKEEDLDATFVEGEPSTTTTSEKGKGGRKPTDLVQVVNQLIDEDVLFGWQDKEGKPVEIKTIEDVRQLIKDNLSESGNGKEDEWWEKKKGAYSPQVQAVLHYAEQGAQSATEIAQLLGAIREVEEAVEIDMNTSAGHEQVVRQTLKSKGFKDSYVDKQVNILKDLGDDKLKEEAEELYPELVAMRQTQVQQAIADQERRRKDAEEASKVYVSTIRKTLDKEVVGDVKLSKEDKARLYEAVTKPSYTSLNGSATNLFVKTLEELQFGKNANYDHFMNIVQYAIDPKGFLQKLKTSVGNEIADDTFRKLKTAKSSIATTDSQEDVNRGTPKRTITKGGSFVNPYS